MRKYLTLILALGLLVGCTYEGKKIKNYFEEPKWLLKDPHYAAYKDELGSLESLYLKKELTYAEYMGQKKALDEKYDKEVQKRESITSNL